MVSTGKGSQNGRAKKDKAVENALKYLREHPQDATLVMIRDVEARLMAVLLAKKEQQQSKDQPY